MCAQRAAGRQGHHQERPVTMWLGPHTQVAVWLGPRALKWLWGHMPWGQVAVWLGPCTPQLAVGTHAVGADGRWLAGLWPPQSRRRLGGGTEMAWKRSRRPRPPLAPAPSIPKLEPWGQPPLQANVQAPALGEAAQPIPRPQGSWGQGQLAPRLATPPCPHASLAQ